MPSDFITFKVCLEVQVMIPVLLITLHQHKQEAAAFSFMFDIASDHLFGGLNRSGNQGAVQQIRTGVYLIEFAAAL